LRLATIDSFGGIGIGMLSRNLEKTLHQALAYANERRHEHVTLEHLLLAVTEDQDAVLVLRACGVDLDQLRREVLNYVDNELGNLVDTHGDDAKPTASFQRVLQRAAIHVQSSDREEVTGANVLVAMFAERESHAVFFLMEQGITRFDAVNYLSHGTAKAPGHSEIPRAQKAGEGERNALYGREGRIIEKPGGWPATKQLRCSFCAKSQREARNLIAGPGVFICDECVESCVSLLRGEAFSQPLELRPSQTLIMTRQLQQAIKMLQLSNLDLTDFVDSEIQQNPLLERYEGELGDAAAANDPRLAFDPPLARPVVPDILMRAQPDGGWGVELNAETLPRVLVNNEYYARARQATRSKAEKDYLTERLHAANWLVKSLHARATTILKVAAEIVRQQDAFFRHGVPSLRPLILRDIADSIGMHESTVSRATSNKYIATPRGLYELIYFFTG
jgi:hypothetical protein